MYADMAMLAPSRAAAVFLGGLLFWSRIAAAQDSTPSLVEAAPESPAPLSISSDCDCPSGPAITAELATLLPPAEWPSGTVRVRSLQDRLIVDLVADTATQRELAASGDCGTRATTVALVIATWTGELAVAGEPALSGAGMRQERPAQPIAAPAFAAASTRERELDLGLLLSLSGGLVPGVGIEYVQTRAPRGLGWQVGLLLPAQREVSGAGATARWTRAVASVAVNGRMPLRPLALSFGVGLVGAYTLSSGRGYSLEQDEQALTGGLVAEARASFLWRPLRLWTSLRGYRWLFSQSIVIETQDGHRVTTLDLPSWDFQWVLGFGYVFR